MWTKLMLATVFFLSSNLFADLRYSEVFGVVTDPKGFVLPGVEVIARKGTAKGWVEVRRTTTNDKGRYRLAMLERGNYEIIFEFPGFYRESSCEISVTPPKSKRGDIKFHDDDLGCTLFLGCPKFSNIDPTSSTMLYFFSDAAFKIQVQHWAELGYAQRLQREYTIPILCGVGCLGCRRWN